MLPLVKLNSTKLDGWLLSSTISGQIKATTMLTELAYVITLSMGINRIFTRLRLYKILMAIS